MFATSFYFCPILLELNRGLFDNKVKVLLVLSLGILEIMSYNNIVLGKLVMVCQSW